MQTNKSSRHEPVAKVYAKAFFELAVEKNIIQQAKDELKAFLDLLSENIKLKQVLTSYAFSLEERESILKNLAQKLQLHALLTRFLQTLLLNNRLQVLAEIYEAFCNYVDEHQNIVRGTITAVEPLTQNECHELESAFSKKFGKQVHLEQVTDPLVLGGLVVQIKGLTFDGSLQTALHSLKENLERHAI